MVVSKAPLCASCKHFRPEPPAGKAYGFSCDAFPDGIPDDILNWEADYRKEYPGDHGIQYEEQKLE